MVRSDAGRTSMAVERGVRHRRRWAFAWTFDRCGALVYAVALHVTGDRVEAEAVTLETFRRLPEELERVHSGSVTARALALAHRLARIDARSPDRLDTPTLAFLLTPTECDVLAQALAGRETVREMAGRFGLSSAGVAEALVAALGKLSTVPPES